MTRQWPLPREQVEAIDAFFEKKLKAGQVRESKSPHSAPTFCVKKATGGWRIVHAYNKLNAATIPAQTPIPRRDTVIDSMNGSRIFSTIDLTDGYYQLLMRMADIPLTACSTPSGMLWEWLVMPQGLKNAPATFNRLVTTLFRPMRLFAQTYFDDIYVFSKATETKTASEVHLEHLRRVFECMAENKLYANLRKCIFHVEEIPVLGCYVGVNGVRADPEKVKAVADWPTPRNVKDLRKWLGLANYLHRFSKNYADTARVLSDLLRKGTTFRWDPNHQTAFEAIKKSLVEAPILALPNFDTPFWVVCDASDFAIGCALMQHDDDGVERVVVYQSRSLKAAEKNYPVHDKELLAMKYALVKFRVYLLGSKPFVIYTDHASLTTATQSPHLSQRMARWLSFFAEYNFTVKYKPGRHNILADALSRRPDYDPKEVDSILGISVPTSSLHDEIRTLYEGDDDCRLLVDHFEGRQPKFSELTASLKSRLHRFSYRDRLLYFALTPTEKPRLFVPDDADLRMRLIREFHDTPIGGHLGREKTYAALSEDFYWRRMYKHVARYVQLCEICHAIKPSSSLAAPLQSLPIPSECWRDVSLDYIFGFPKDIHRHTGVLVFVCRLSKMVHLVPCSKSVDAEKSAQLFLDTVFKHHGLPERLVSDRDPRFTGKFWREVFNLLGTKLNMSTARHPESDGQTERANRVIEDILRSFCQKFPKRWSSLLPLVEFAINNTQHVSTGFTPFFVNGLTHPRVPATLSLPETGVPRLRIFKKVDTFLQLRLGILRMIRDQMAESQDQQKANADRHGRRNATEFECDDMVWLSTKGLPPSVVFKILPQHANAKLQPRFIGPYKVLEKVGPRSYLLDLPSSFGRTHPVFYVGLLKRSRASNPEWGRDLDDVDPSAVDNVTPPPPPQALPRPKLDPAPVAPVPPVAPAPMDSPPVAPIPEAPTPLPSPTPSASPTPRRNLLRELRAQEAEADRSIDLRTPSDVAEEESTPEPSSPAAPTLRRGARKIVLPARYRESAELPIVRARRVDVPPDSEDASHVAVGAQPLLSPTSEHAIATSTPLETRRDHLREESRGPADPSRAVHWSNPLTEVRQCLQLEVSQSARGLLSNANCVAQSAHSQHLTLRGELRAQSPDLLQCVSDASRGSPSLHRSTSTHTKCIDGIGTQVRRHTTPSESYSLSSPDKSNRGSCRRHL